MPMDRDPPTDEPTDDSFRRQLAAPSAPFWRELVAFLREEKKWWLVPFLIALASIGLFVVFVGHAPWPWLYPLF